MSLWTIIAVLLSLTAAFAYLNHRWIRLPPSIGVMTMALSFSLCLLALQSIGFEVAAPMQSLVEQAHFDSALLHGFLGFLLFAAALSVDLSRLRANGAVVITLATVGVILSTIVVGLGAYCVFMGLGQPLPWSYCFLFGALISPTDPVAVLALLKRVGASSDLESKIAGESLFNDGVAVALFLLLLPLVGGRATPSVGDALWMLLRETVGGVAFGAIAGWTALRLLRRVDQYTVEILLTLALVSGGFALANALAVSAPLAIVVAGLIVGHQGRNAMSTITRHHLDLFWHLLDEIFNAILFVLIGLEVLVMHFHARYLGIVLALVPVVLLARLVSVGIPYGFLRQRLAFAPGTLLAMVWGGLRGGLPVAMALSIPFGGERDMLVAATYGVVVVGLLVQGSSLRWFLPTRDRDHRDSQNAT